MCEKISFLLPRLPQALSALERFFIPTTCTGFPPRPVFKGRVRPLGQITAARRPFSRAHSPGHGEHTVARHGRIGSESQDPLFVSVYRHEMHCWRCSALMSSLTGSCYILVLCVKRHYSYHQLWRCVVPRGTMSVMLSSRSIPRRKRSVADLRTPVYYSLARHHPLPPPPAVIGTPTTSNPCVSRSGKLAQKWSANVVK